MSLLKFKRSVARDAEQILAPKLIFLSYARKRIFFCFCFFDKNSKELSSDQF